MNQGYGDTPLGAPSAHDARLADLGQTEEAIASGFMMQQKDCQKAVNVFILVDTEEYKTHRPRKQIWQIRSHVSRNVGHYILCNPLVLCLLATAGSANISL